MSRYTRKKKQLSKLRGGAVAFLDPARHKISSPQDIATKIELLTLSCHGETTRDGRFIMVPPKTYLMFLSHSGEPSPGENPIEKVYYGYKNPNGEQGYYERLYKHIFRPYAERAENNLVLPNEQLYIYQPGDVIPDYLLSFSNNSLYTFKHGIYQLPIRGLSGQGKEVSLYLGRPIGYIRKLLKSRQLTLEDLDELSAEDKEKILNEDKFPEAILEDHRVGTISSPIYFVSKLKKKVESICCGTDDNLLKSDKFNQQQIRENLNRVRLSTILQRMPRDTTKEMRFIVMNFCRVSYLDTIRDYFGSKIRFPRLLRSLSFSGKCTYDTREQAFNIFTIFSIFCSFGPAVKAKMLEQPEIRELVRLLKKVLTTPSGDFREWKKCMEPLYSKMNSSNIFNLVQNYEGFLTTEEVTRLSEFYDILNRLKDEESDERIKSQYEILIGPFKALHTQLEAQTAILSERARDKREAIRVFYDNLNEIIKPYSVGRSDFLKLQFVSENDLIELLKGVREGGDIRQDLEKIVEKAKKYNEEHKNNGNEYDVQDAIKIMMEEWMGQSENEAYHVTAEAFPNMRIKNNSTPIENNNNEVNGGRRKTVKKKNHR